MAKRLLIIDCGSNALDFAMRSQEHGWDVKWFDKNRKDGSRRLSGRGMVDKIFDYDLLRVKWIEWADLIFLPDNASYMEMLEPFRVKGYPIFGPGLEATRWEHDRNRGQEVMRKAGLGTLKSVEFHDYDDAASYVEKHPTFLVSKPNGEDPDKAMSYVADAPSDLIHMLQDRWKRNEKYRGAAKADGFILQEKMHGVELAVGGIFGPAGWAECWYENWEYKKLMVGDCGPNTGEMGTLSQWVKKSKLADIALRPMEKQLKAIDYVGFIDIAGMIGDDGKFAPFEFTMRPFWPGFHNIMATTEGDVAQQMLDWIMGRNTWQIDYDTICVSVVIAIPDFPYSHLTQKEICGIPIYVNCDSKQAHLSEVMLQEDVPCMVGDQVMRMPNYVSAGDYVAVICGCGDTITGARRSAYSAVKKFKMPGNAFYRTDIGAGRVTKQLAIAQKHGFAKHFRV